LLQTGEDLLREFLAGGRQRSLAWGKRGFDASVFGRWSESYRFAVDGELGDEFLLRCGSLRGLGSFRHRVFAGIGVAIVVDGGEAAKKQRADVGESGSAAGRDASAGEELVERGEGVIDALGVEEIAGVAGEESTVLFVLWVATRPLFRAVC
jgi:hypothetical protein